MKAAIITALILTAYAYWIDSMGLRQTGLKRDY
jgi:hypothetical protein